MNRLERSRGHTEKERETKRMKEAVRMGVVV